MTLKDVINNIVTTHSDKTAFIFQNMNLSFTQYNQRVNSLINALLALGIKKADRVAVIANNCPQYFEIYSVAKAGMVCVPLNYRLKNNELAYIINDSEATTLIVESEFLNTIREIRNELKKVKSYICLDATADDMLSYEKLIREYPPDEPDVMVTDNDLCVLFYTSGTTGLPKGAMHTHQTVVDNALKAASAAYGMVPDDKVLCIMPFFHVGGSIFYLLPSFVTGCTTAILGKFDPQVVLDTIQKLHITHMHPVPTMIIRIMEQPDFNKYDLRTLRTIIYAASPMPFEALKRGLELFGNVFIQSFGQTESGCLTALNKEEHTIAGSQEDMKKLFSVGKPLPRVTIKIFDENDKEVSVGEVGEIVAKSDTIMKGYWNLPKETEETLRGGWLHTGDMGYYDDKGYIYIVDRKKDMIISGGENIYSKEVEDILYKHPAVLEASVIGIPDPYWVEKVHAVITLKEGASATADEIMEFCKKQIAGYKTPKSVEIVDSIPKSAAGKILKKELREKYWKGQSRKI